MTQDAFVDVAFPLRGATLPLDHGYALFAAVSRLIPRMHHEPTWGIHPVHGSRTGPGVLKLKMSSQLTLRVPAVKISELLALAGQTLDVAGHRVHTSIPRVFPIRCRPAIRSRFVTIKKFTLEGPDLQQAIRRQLDALGVSTQATVVSGPRRVQRISNHLIVGFPVALDGLTADESVRIQASGLGGRRHMGAGIFMPLVSE